MHVILVFFLSSSLLKVDNHLMYQRSPLTTVSDNPCAFRNCSACPILDAVCPSLPRSVPVNLSYLYVSAEVSCSDYIAEIVQIAEILKLSLVDRCPSNLSPVSTTRADGPSWLVTGFHYPSTRPVLTGNGNQSLLSTVSDRLSSQDLEFYFSMI